MCKKSFNFGIIGCGKIAAKFAESLKVVNGAELHAVASKSKERALKFQNEHDARKCYDDYEKLVKDPEIDAIYIATTHNFHYENSILCIENGKAVLCEKPMTVNARETEELVRLARNKKIFLMEAFWTRFLPATRKLNQLLSEKIIGDIRMFQADFGYHMPYDPENRSYNPDLAGGALLDVGIYPINFAQMIFKKYPLEIRSAMVPSGTGVDEQSAYILGYPGGELAVLHSAVGVETRHQAWIYGTDGYIHIPAFFHASHFHVKRDDGYEETFSIPYESTGYGYEAMEVMHCIQKGLYESSVMPLAETLEIMRIMDHIRNSWGLHYPNDTTSS